MNFKLCQIEDYNVYQEQKINQINGNLNIISIAFASPRFLQKISKLNNLNPLIQDAFIVVNQKKTVFVRILADSNIFDEEKLFVSKNIYLYLQQLGTLEYALERSNYACFQHEKNHRLNCFPQFQIAKTVKISNIFGKNSQLFKNVNFLKNMIKQPFIAFKGMQFNIKINDPQLLQIQNMISNEIRVNKLLKTLNKSSYYQFINFEINEFDAIDQDICIIDFRQNTQLIVDEIPINRFVIQDYQLSNNIFSNFCLEFTQKFEKQIQFQNFQKFVLTGRKGTGKKTFLKHICQNLNFNYFDKDCEQINSLQKIVQFIEKSIIKRPAIIHIRNFKQIQKISQNNNIISTVKELFSKIDSIYKLSMLTQYPIILVFSCESFQDNDIQDHLCKSIFDLHFEMPKLIINDIEQILKNILVNELTSEEISQLSQQSLNIPIYTIIKNINMQQQNYKQPYFLQKILQKFQSLNNQINKEASISKVEWDDVGGLKEAKNDILDSILLPQLHPEIFNEFIKPRTGLLFYGPPGTGKTLLAKCIATECKMSFFSVKGPELLNMYIGESEKNIRDIFKKARESAPSIIFFDELDALLPRRGGNMDSGSVMDRIVAQFLTELDEFDQHKMVIVIGATNRPDLLDQSLLRPGRFDKLVYLGIQEDPESRIKVLKAQTRSLQLDSDVDFEVLEKLVMKNFTGADFYNLTQQAVLSALQRKILKIEQLYEKQKENISFHLFTKDLVLNDSNIQEIIINMQDFVSSLDKIKPSVSMQELQNYKNLQQQFSK